MNLVYETIRTIHNAVGGLTLLLTLAAAVTLLLGARSSAPGPALVLRSAFISASLQGVLGIILLILAGVFFPIGYLAGLWLHILLGLAAVGLVSVAIARARRAPDSAARRYGSMLIGVFVVVLLAFLVGQFRIGL
jgi:hypothetical protein